MPSHVLIIGGSHGIGFELVKRLLDRDVHVTCVSRTPGNLKSDRLVDHPGLNHVGCDATTEAVADLELPEALDGFVYCPGSINLGPIKSLKLDQLRADLELNTVGAVRCFQRALPALRAADSASAVFFSTVAVNRGIAMHSSVAAVKGAVQALAKTWAAELAPKIRVNCLAPALTDTPLSATLLSSPAKRDAMSHKYPLGRVGQPTDIAAAADFLLSDDASWITGQTFGIDGGMSATVAL